MVAGYIFCLTIESSDCQFLQARKLTIRRAALLTLPGGAPRKRRQHSEATPEPCSRPELPQGTPPAHVRREHMELRFSSAGRAVIKPWMIQGGNSVFEVGTDAGVLFQARAVRVQITAPLYPNVVC